MMWLGPTLTLLGPTLTLTKMMDINSGSILLTESVEHDGNIKLLKAALHQLAASFKDNKQTPSDRVFTERESLPPTSAKLELATPKVSKSNPKDDSGSDDFQIYFVGHER